MAVQVKCDEKKQVAFVPLCGHFLAHPSQSTRRMGHPPVLVTPARSKAWATRQIIQPGGPGPFFEGHCLRS